MWVSLTHTHTSACPHRDTGQVDGVLVLIGLVCHVTREPSRPVGAQQHDGPGAATYQELSP